MARPELKSVEDLGMKRQAPAPAPKAQDRSSWQRIKQFGGDATYMPARKVGEYLTDAVKDNK